MREGVCVFVLKVVFKIVYVQVAVGEGLSRCDVKVANYFVDLNATFKTTSLLALGIKVFGIMLAFALFNILAATKRPRY